MQNIRIGRGKFCSRKCMGRWNSKYKIGAKAPCWRGGIKTKMTCPVCKKEFFRTPGEMRKGGMKFCSKSCQGFYILKYHHKYQDTSIELAIEKELLKRGIPFKKQIPIWKARTVVDFLLPNKTVVYCDGNYFHDLPDNKNRDRNQNFMLHFMGYKVYRFTEPEIKKSPAECIKRILKKEKNLC